MSSNSEHHIGHLHLHHSAASRAGASPRPHAIDVGDAKTPGGRQAAVAGYLAELGGGEGPGFFTYPNFLCYLARSSAALDGVTFADTFARAARTLLELAEGPVYLADGSAFVGEALHDEFPELVLFRLPVADAFVESPVHPGIFIETRRFADLHLLSRMRRELKRSGLAAEQRSVDVVKILLGLEAVA